MTELDLKVDRSNMLKELYTLPDHIKKAWNLADKIEITPPKYILLVGMGGSAIAGDLLGALLQKKYDLRVSRGYETPPAEFVIASSYSGNTEETLSAFENSRKNNADILAISSGGELTRHAEDTGANIIKLPSGFQPRVALPYLFFPLLRVLAPEYQEELEGLYNFLNAERKALWYDNPKSPPLEIAEEIFSTGRVPISYGSGILEPLAHRFKTQLNENSKCLAFWDTFPEMNHNDTVGWAGEKNRQRFLPIVFRNPSEHPRVSKRIALTKNLIWQNTKILEIECKGETELQKLWYGIYVADLASIYLALLEGVDPTPVEIITKLKIELAKG
jgi:glucose/mannose-6-phosphate isomerase